MPDATSTRASHRAPSSGGQRGNALLVVLIALTGLGTLAVVTLTSVQSGISVVTHDRSQATALLAAESGAHAAISFLRTLSFRQKDWFSNNIRVRNDPFESPAAIRGNDRRPGQSGNPFTIDMNAWYQVSLHNNTDDPNFTGVYSNDPTDTDGRVFIHSIGYGPNRASAMVIVEVQGYALDPSGNIWVGSVEPPREFRSGPMALDGIAILSWRQIE